MLQDELLDQEEGLLVVDMLPDLHDCAPCVRGELLLAVITLHINLSKLSDEGLLHLGFIIELLLYGQLDLDALGMRLCPHEPCLQDLGTVEPFDLLEQQRQQILAISFAGDPGRSHVSMAESTEIDDAFLGNSESDVGFGDGAGLTDVTDGGNELYAAHGAKDGDLPFDFDLHC